MTKHERVNVLGIVGSPRQGGNTDIMVEEILRGAEEAGAKTEKIMIGDMAIAPCQACNACRESGKCVQTDDMEELFDKMKSSRVWVLGTPVYWWGPSAQIKAFVDRWFAKGEGQARREIFENRLVILAAPMGDTDPATGRHVVGMFTDALAYVKARLFASILATGAYDAGDVRSNKEILSRARQAGRDAVTA